MRILVVIVFEFLIFGTLLSFLNQKVSKNKIHGMLTKLMHTLKIVRQKIGNDTVEYIFTHPKQL